jgi:hypothetical protein
MKGFAQFPFGPDQNAFLFLRKDSMSEARSEEPGNGAKAELFCTTRPV